MAQPIVVEDVETPGQAGGVKVPVLTLLIAVVAAVMVSVLVLCGLGYYLIRGGKLPIVVNGAAVSAAKTAIPAEGPIHALTLDPMVVNLADEGGKAYVRIGLTLHIADAEKKKDAKPKEEKGEDPSTRDEQIEVRDTALDVLGRQTAEALLDPDGKKRLKAELKTALAKRNPDLAVRDIFFGEFLVQR